MGTYTDTSSTSTASTRLMLGCKETESHQPHAVAETAAKGQAGHAEHARATQP